MDSRQKAKNEKALKIITILMIASILLSAVFARAEEHDCTGEECPICQVFQTAKLNLQSIILKAYTFTKQIKYSISFLVLFPVTALLPFSTLVTEKIKLND